MDELTRWQMEERARHAREIRDWVESGGAAEMARALSEQLQVLRDPDLLAAAKRVAAQARELDITLARAAVKFQATYGEVIAVLVRLHQVYVGIGSTFTVTSDESGPEGATTHERLLSLPAANMAAIGGKVSLSGHVEAKVIVGSAALTLDDATVSATGRIIEESVSLSRAASLSASATVINHQSTWSLERSENSQGQHVFVIRGIGGQEMRRKVDILVEVAQEVMNGEVAAQPSRHSLAASDSHDGVMASTKIIELGLLAELPSKPAKVKAGRKADPENETAYKQILDGGNTEEAATAAFFYWCEAKHIGIPNQRDRDAFNAAMKRAARRTQAKATDGIPDE